MWPAWDATMWPAGDATSLVRRVVPTSESDLSEAIRAPFNLD